jgi:hypothetical protein
VTSRTSRERRAAVTARLSFLHDQSTSSARLLLGLLPSGSAQVPWVGAASSSFAQVYVFLLARTCFGATTLGLQPLSGATWQTLASQALASQGQTWGGFFSGRVVRRRRWWALIALPASPSLLSASPGAATYVPWAAFTSWGRRGLGALARPSWGRRGLGASEPGPEPRWELLPPSPRRLCFRPRALREHRLRRR